MRKRKRIIIAGVLAGGVLVAFASIYLMSSTDSAAILSSGKAGEELEQHNGLADSEEHVGQKIQAEAGERAGHEALAAGGEQEGEGRGAHAGEDGREEHGDEEKLVRLSKEVMKEYGVEVASAAPGKLEIEVDLPGEVAANPDRLAHVVPRVSGIVREVRKRLGDRVRAGEVMAILESRELADSKSAYLAAKERLALAEANFRREEDLWKKKISAEQEYLEAKQALAEARIELRSAEQKLHALGFSEDYLAGLPDHPDVSFTRYEIAAPFDGTVIKKHITLGEKLNGETEAFVVADLTSVWANLSVYPKDLPLLRVGQPAVIATKEGSLEATGTVSYLSPLVDETTRTATARVVLPNPDGQWRPGVFISGRVTVSNVDVPVLVPRTALTKLDGETCVFVETGEGFKPRVVEMGQSNRTHVEIVSGLNRGERYVVANVFVIKAEMGKSSFGGHGH